MPRVGTSWLVFARVRVALRDMFLKTIDLTLTHPASLSACCTPSLPATAQMPRLYLLLLQRCRTHSTPFYVPRLRQNTEPYPNPNPNPTPNPQPTPKPKPNPDPEPNLNSNPNSEVEQLRQMLKEMEQKEIETIEEIEVCPNTISTTNASTTTSTTTTTYLTPTQSRPNWGWTSPKG